MQERLLHIKSLDSDSSSEDDDAFFNNISSVIQQRTIQQQTEIKYVNQVSLPDVTIYPTNIHFKTTYPNKSLQSKIIISNGGKQNETFNVSIKGDREFSISTNKIELIPGETQSLVITFSPRKVSLFNASLILEGRTSIVAPITGHCITSPLEYPLFKSASWCFPKKNTEKLITFSNNSLSESLHVILATNCPAFSVSPSQFDIVPSSSFDISLSFNPSEQLANPATISIQCSQSGDSTTIPLTIAPKREKILVDFGTISVGRKIKQTLNLKHSQLAPIVQWPFGMENISPNGMPQSTMIFSFTARQVGDFRSKVSLTDFDLEFKATAVDPPYRIKIPSKFPQHPLKIQNISESMLNLAFSLNTTSYLIDPETADLIPNQIEKLYVHIQTESSFNSNEVIMKVIWATQEGKRVIDEYNLPLNENQSSIEFENASSSQKKSMLKSNTEINPEDVSTLTSTSELNTKSKLSSIYNSNIIQKSRKLDKKSKVTTQNDKEYYSSSSMNFEENNNLKQQKPVVDDIDYSEEEDNHKQEDLLKTDSYDKDEYANSVYSSDAHKKKKWNEKPLLSRNTKYLPSDNSSNKQSKKMLVQNDYEYSDDSIKKIKLNKRQEEDSLSYSDDEKYMPKLKTKRRDFNENDFSDSEIVQKPKTKSSSRLTQMTQTKSIRNRNIKQNSSDSFDEELELLSKSRKKSYEKEVEEDRQSQKNVSFVSQSNNKPQRWYPPTASSSVIPFFGVSSRTPTYFELTINSNSNIEVEAPDWVQLPHMIIPHSMFSMVVSSLPSETRSSNFTIHSETGELQLPILAYKGRSNLVFGKEIDLIEITDDQYTASMVVKNIGDRSGFIAFTLSDSMNVNLRVSPPVAIIEPNGSQQVKFLFTIRNSEFTIPIVVYHGDEILRQLQSMVQPNDYMSTAFHEIENANEVSEFENAIGNCKPQDVLKAIRKCTSTSKLVFKRPQKSIGLNRYTISPSAIEFVADEEGKVSILNLSPEPLSFIASATSKNVNFSPHYGSAPPYGEAIINVTLDSINESNLIVKIGRDSTTIPLKKFYSSSLNTKKREVISAMNETITQNRGFMVTDTAIEFDCVPINQSKTIQFVVINNDRQQTTLFLSPTNKFFKCDSQITLGPEAHEVVNVVFTPKTVGVVNGKLDILNQFKKISLELSGEGVSDLNSVSSFITHPLEFPTCLPGTIRRAQLRVSNKLDQVVEITAYTEEPFCCPYPHFEIEPYSYVLAPIRFIPKEAGEYSGRVEFRSSSGTVTAIELYGACIDTDF